MKITSFICKYSLVDWNQSNLRRKILEIENFFIAQNSSFFYYWWIYNHFFEIFILWWRLDKSLSRQDWIQSNLKFMVGQISEILGLHPSHPTHLNHCCNNHCCHHHNRHPTTTYPLHLNHLVHWCHNHHPTGIFSIKIAPKVMCG